MQAPKLEATNGTIASSLTVRALELEEKELHLKRREDENARRRRELTEKELQLKRREDETQRRELTESIEAMPVDFKQMVDSDGNLREGSAIEALLRTSMRAMSPEDISVSFIESLSLTASRTSGRSAKGNAGAGVFGSAGIFVQSRKIRNAKKVSRPYNDVDVMLVQHASLDESLRINDILGDSYTAQSCAVLRMLRILEHAVDEKTIAAIDVGSITQVENYDDNTIALWVHPRPHEGFVGVNRIDWETGAVRPNNVSINGVSVEPHPFLQNGPMVSVYDVPNAASRTSAVAAPLQLPACAKMYAFLATHGSTPDRLARARTSTGRS